ncbi:type 1 fimbrial protein [Pseudomonas sp. NFXW11]|uniref:fimbrial protein n=1 Tax=Pseudomonas sp. NFXW11 TaxID=2819531 RepID=UPI003CEB1331
MKKLWLAAGMASGLLMAAGSAWASPDVTLQFTGKVSSETCKIGGVEQGGYTHEVPLPPVGASALAAKGAVAGLKPFELKFTGCTGSTVGVWFKPDLLSVDPLTGALRNQIAQGSNAQVQLLDGQQQPLNLVSIAPDDVQKVNVSDGDATLKFYAQYLAAEDNTSAGDVKAHVVLDMVFE